MNEFKLVGVYQIIPTQASIEVAANYYKYDWLINNHGKYKEEIHWEDFNNLGLLEFQVFGVFSPSDLMSISQDDQSPYMEYYLDPIGVKRILENEAINIEGRRVCFFLHFIDTTKPLKVGSKEIILTKLTNLPDRLVPYTHYIPVD